MVDAGQKTPTPMSVFNDRECQSSVIAHNFDSKDELVAEVMQRTMNADAVLDTDDPVDGYKKGLEHVASHPASFQTMARALMDGDRSASGDGPFTAFKVHRDRLERDRADDSGAIGLDVLPAALMALTTGWACTEDRWLRTAGSTDADRARVRQATVRVDRTSRRQPSTLTVRPTPGCRQHPTQHALVFNWDMTHRCLIGSARKCRIGLNGLAPQRWRNHTPPGRRGRPTIAAFERGRTRS